MSLYYYIEDLLKLKRVHVTNVNNNPKETKITIECPVSTHVCPSCGENTNRVHDYRLQVIKDIPIHTKPTLLVYRRRRYKCIHCQKCFSENNNFFAKYQHKTSRLNLFILAIYQI